MRTKSTNNTLLGLVFLLILVVLGLSYYTYDFHSSVSAREKQLASDKELVSRQLQEEIQKYNDLLKDRNHLKEALSGAQDRLKELEQSLAQSDLSSSVIRRLRLEVRKLRQEREYFIDRTDSLAQETERLTELQKRTQEALDKATKSQDSIKNSNTALSLKLKDGARLTGSGLLARGVIQRSSGKFINTIRATRTEMLQVCYVVNKNVLAQPREETFYIQVRQKDGGMVGIERSLTLSDGPTIRYNTQTSIPYKGSTYSVCELVLPVQKLEPGTYIVSIYNRDALFLTTTLDLK